MLNMSRKNVLLAVVLLVAMMAIYVEAQGYYGGRGYGGGYGGRGGYGGGRGYYGGGGRGYGGGYGGRGGYGGGRGYGGNYGGGYGRGGYRDYSDYGHNSVYPNYGGSSSGGGGGGYYNEYDVDDYSSYGGLNVYASASSNPGLSESSVTTETADGTSNRAIIASGQPSRDLQPSSVLDLLNTVTGGGGDGTSNMWPMGTNGGDSWQQSGSSTGRDLFDLVTSGDQSVQNGQRGGAVSSGAADRASERNVLAPARVDRRDPAANASDSVDTRPSVPTSTTTPAPEFIMINPTTIS